MFSTPHTNRVRWQVVAAFCATAAVIIAVTLVLALLPDPEDRVGPGPERPVPTLPTAAPPVPR